MPSSTILYCLCKAAVDTASFVYETEVKLSVVFFFFKSRQERGDCLISAQKEAKTPSVHHTEAGG